MSECIWAFTTAEIVLRKKKLVPGICTHISKANQHLGNSWTDEVGRIIMSFPGRLHTALNWTETCATHILQRQRWKTRETEWSAYGISRALRYHPQPKWHTTEMVKTQGWLTGLGSAQLSWLIYWLILDVYAVLWKLVEAPMQSTLKINNHQGETKVIQLQEKLKVWFTAQFM